MAGGDDRCWHTEMAPNVRWVNWKWPDDSRNDAIDRRFASRLTKAMMPQELGVAMKNGLYSATTKGFDGVDWPPGGVFFLQNGVLLGGSSFM